MPTQKQKQVNYVYVVDANGTPVMPTSRLGMVRRWLKSGQAVWYGNSRTTIQFVRPIDTQTQPLTLGVNTGFHLGMAVVGNDREYYASESIRKSEKDRITARREYRRTRRNRLRYRKPRFDNRRRKAGWLAPSVQHGSSLRFARFNACTGSCRSVSWSSRLVPSTTKNLPIPPSSRGNTRKEKCTAIKQLRIIYWSAIITVMPWMVKSTRPRSYGCTTSFSTKTVARISPTTWFC